jgi:hypothetical protein
VFAWHRVVALSLLAGCSLLTSLDDLGGGAEAGADASNDGAPDTLVGDASSDAPADGAQGLSDLSRWSAFDLTTLGGSPTGLWGGTYDGRYVYLTPSAQEFVTSQIAYRLDTTASFASTAAWTKFDVASVGAGANNFAGTAFDGHFVYLAPTWGATVTARYDTTATFAQTSSWALFDGGAVFTHRQGSAFDGQYVYFAPLTEIVTRFDTTQTFAAPSSWTSVDVSTFSDAGATSGFTGALYDGHYVYFLPPSTEFGNGTGSIVLRYDTKAAFGAAASWSSFDMLRVSPLASGFVGGAFDGRYLYAVPYQNQTAFDGVVVRYDTQAVFGAVSSWETFDAQTLSAQAAGFSGASFDGRYVYFSPHGFGNVGLVVRYDTQATFALASSWSTFDTHAVDVNAGGFMGAIFDGAFVYFVPGAGHVLVRFDARPPSKPPENGGSFF